MMNNQFLSSNGIKALFFLRCDYVCLVCACFSIRHSLWDACWASCKAGDHTRNSSAKSEISLDSHSIRVLRLVSRARRPAANPTRKCMQWSCDPLVSSFTANFESLWFPHVLQCEIPCKGSRRTDTRWAIDASCRPQIPQTIFQALSVLSKVVDQRATCRQGLDWGVSRGRNSRKDRPKVAIKAWHWVNTTILQAETRKSFRNHVWVLFWPFPQRSIRGLCYQWDFRLI